MGKYFHDTFLEPELKEWFSSGLIIESTRPAGAVAAYERLSRVLPYVVFDLVSKTERPGMGFRNTFLVRRPFGGLRLLWAARKDYELVVLFATGDWRLWLARAFALLVMRPRRFFVFNEWGDGFWVHKNEWPQIRQHFDKRWFLERRKESLRAFGRALAWPFRPLLHPIRLGKGIAAVLLFLLAFLCLTVLRLSYDKYRYRFRFFGKTASAPRRDLESTAPAAARPGAQSAT